MQTTWGRYPWSIEHGIDKIHPDDLEEFKNERNNTKLFERIHEDHLYMLLRYRNKVYRVKKELFKEVPTPQFRFEQVVHLDSGHEAIITDVFWHYDKQEPFYFVTVEGKKKSKRYFESDLNSI